MSEETCYYDDNHDVAAGNVGLGLEEDLRLSSYSIEQPHLNPNSQVNFELDHNNWDTQDHQQQIDLQCFNPGVMNNLPPPPTPDLLNLFHLPRFPNSSISFGRPTLTEAGRYDSQLHLDLPPQQTPIFKELFHSMPHGSCYFGMDERDDGFYQDGADGRQYENSMLNFSRDNIPSLGMGKAEGGKGNNRQHFATERQRREQLNGKYTALRTLVPNPTKADRASIVHDAIQYIKELLRTVDELKILVDKKRYGMERFKRRKNEDEASGDMESSSMKPLTLTDRDQSNGTTSRGTWLKRKSKETEVDVRIIEDEVTIKLIQRKKFNCLLSVSKILDDLQLALLHISGGNIGNSNCFLFNTKILEGSSVHACAIANKLIEAVDKNYGAAFEPSSF